MLSTAHRPSFPSQSGTAASNQLNDQPLGPQSSNGERAALEAVARHLRDQALALEDASNDDADAFGRSAFNRYYYAAYLVTRQILQPVLPDLPKQHATLPEFLRTTVRGDLGKRRLRATRAGDHTAAKSTQEARQATLLLAEILVAGYGSRVMADYHPEVPVAFDAKDFKLNEVRSTDAQNWRPKAKHLAMIIAAAMRQTDAS